MSFILQTSKRLDLISTEVQTLKFWGMKLGHCLEIVAADLEMNQLGKVLKCQALERVVCETIELATTSD